MEESTGIVFFIKKIILFFFWFSLDTHRDAYLHLSFPLTTARMEQTLARNRREELLQSTRLSRRNVQE